MALLCVCAHAAAARAEPAEGTTRPAGEAPGHEGPQAAAGQEPSDEDVKESNNPLATNLGVNVQIKRR